MKTTAELQARKEALMDSERKSVSILNCCVPASEAIELIEEILRLREEVASLRPAGGAAIVLTRADVEHLTRPYAPPNQEPVKWITGKPYRNDDRP